MSDASTKRKRRFRVTRRGFLIGLGATGAALAVGVAVGRAPFYRYMAQSLEGGGEDGGNGGVFALPNDPIVWFEVTDDNRILFINPKVEMGQGVHTAMTQIAAEELGVRWDQIEMVQGTSQYGPVDGFGTGGSTSIPASFTPLREAAATLREMMIVRGAEILGVEQSNVEAAEATVFTTENPSQLISYADIAAQTAEWPDFETPPALKPASQFQYIGQSVHRIDFESKLRGEAKYGYDMRIDGMHYGAIARPPAIEAKMISATEGTAREMPGVVEIVIDVDRGLAGVVAKTRRQAQMAINRLEIEWDEGKLWEQNELEALLDTSGRNSIAIQLEGQGKRAIGNAPSLSFEYTTPFAAHAHLEAQAALADVKSDSARVWASSQGASFALPGIAEALGMEDDAIEMIPTYLGGGFGRKIGAEVTVEAALLSQGAGVPVHVGWSRLEDMRHGFVRPATKHALSAALDYESGKIVAVSHNISSGEVAFPFLPSFLRLLFGADFGVTRGAFNFYGNIENRQLNTHLVQFPIRTGWWRGLGLLANVFAHESFMDEMAHAAGRDPLQFRLDHLASDAFGNRMKTVLERAAEKAGYGQTLAEGRAHGIACSVDADCVAAMVVEVSVEETGQIVVHHAVQAIDPGLAVNPDGVIAQTQGSIIMGLSSTLIEEITFSQGRVEASNFDRYPLITNDMAPEIDVIVVESDGRPRGMGEPPIGPVAASVGNAVFNLTGKRLRSLPMTPEKVLAA